MTAYHTDEPGFRSAFDAPELRDSFCVPGALAHAAGCTSRDGFRRLTERAAATPADHILDWRGPRVGESLMVSPRESGKEGLAYFLGNEAKWYALAGLREVERVEYGPVISLLWWDDGTAPSLAGFASARGARGRWLAFYGAHVVALVDGTVFGKYNLDARVRYAIRVEPIGGDS